MAHNLMIPMRVWSRAARAAFPALESDVDERWSRQRLAALRPPALACDCYPAAQQRVPQPSPSPHSSGLPALPIAANTSALHSTHQPTSHAAPPVLRDSSHTRRAISWPQHAHSTLCSSPCDAICCYRADTAAHSSSSLSAALVLGHTNHFLLPPIDGCVCYSDPPEAYRRRRKKIHV